MTAGRGRGKIPNRRTIDTRPAEVETRKRVGHWEGDLINGARETGHLSTLVERCTRYTLIDRTDSKEALEVTGALCGLFGQLPPSARLSLTLDNGKEFARTRRSRQLRELTFSSRDPITLGSGGRTRILTA